MIFRIDDYPTGIRPIIDNHIEEFNKILCIFEERKLIYFLGIVPSLCTSEDWEYLNTLKYMIPSCHGYDHLYFKYFKSLKNIDPFNKSGIGGDDNEFFGLSKQETDILISRSLNIIRCKLNKKVYSFIPPFNRINPYLESSLKNNDITLILGECTGINSIYLITSQPYYIKSSDIDNLDIKKAKCITLHITWEWDLLQNKTSKINELIKSCL